LNTIDEAYDAIMEGNTASPAARSLALALLLNRCGGESAIQQGGRGYFPRFCDEGANPTYDFSSESLEASSGKRRLAEVLHSSPKIEELQKIASQLDLSWTVKIQPEKYFESDEARQRLREALAHIRKLCDSPP